MYKVAERPVSVYESYNRAMSGPKVIEKDWDFKIVPQAAARMKKEYNIKFKPKEFIPTDRQMVKDLFQAGMQILVENGVYVIGLQRVIKVTEEEVKEALKKAPSKLIIGEGKDACEMACRSPTDSRYPLVQGGPTGAPVSENVFVPMFQSYAQEAIVDCIVGGVMNTIEGNLTTPGTPWEIKATKAEVAAVREACRRAGRPGLGL